MRGGAVAVLVILHHEGEQFTIMVRQPRVPIGFGNFAEIPAGMLDGDGNFAGIAAKEMKEETGIAIKESELIDMTDLAYKGRYPGVYTSCGGSDEFNRILLYQKAVTAAELESLNGKLTGVAEEGELINLQIVPLSSLWKMTSDAKSLMALTFYHKLNKANLLPKEVVNSQQLFKYKMFAVMLILVVIVLYGIVWNRVYFSKSTSSNINAEL
jgi:ADP-sugar diphosphatase